MFFSQAFVLFAQLGSDNLAMHDASMNHTTLMCEEPNKEVEPAACEPRTCTVSAKCASNWGSWACFCCSRCTSDDCTQVSRCQPTDGAQPAC